MKQEWSSAWKGSSQPRKQRKYRYNAPLHVRHAFLSAHLAKELRKQMGKRSVPVRKGDEVLVMRGSFKGFRGTVDKVNLSKTKIYIEGIKVKKVDGTDVLRPIHPSNLLITRLNLEDRKRAKIFQKVQKQQAKIKESGKEKPAQKETKEQM